MCSAWTAFGSSYTLGKNNHGTERKRVIRSSFPFRALVCWKFLNAGICLFLLAIEVTMLPSGWVICDLACHGSHGCTGCQRWTWCAHVVWDLWILHCALKLVSSGQCNYMCAQIAVSMKYSCQQHSSLQHQRTFACLERGWREVGEKSSSGSPSRYESYALFTFGLIVLEYLSQRLRRGFLFANWV